jgi:protein phosphatase
MQCWGLTDPGSVRPQNQDAYHIEHLDRNTLLCVVCDGMGGAKSGNVASTLAVDVFTQEIKRCWTPSMDRDKIDQMLRGTVKLAHFTVFDQAMQFEEFSGMGTTLVAVLVRGREATVINVGDSRAYLYRNEEIRRITKDHTYVNELIDKGVITEDEAEFHKQKNVITKALGAEPTVSPDFYKIPLHSGDVLLLCTDGLYGEVGEEKMLEALQKGKSMNDTCADLVDLALRSGGRDNITVVCVRI